jgi:hypothetical protein
MTTARVIEMDNKEYWDLINKHNFRHYPNVLATGLQISSHTSGHGMSDEHVNCADLEKILANSAIGEINGEEFYLVPKNKDNPA